MFLDWKATLPQQLGATTTCASCSAQNTACTPKVFHNVMCLITERPVHPALSLSLSFSATVHSSTTLNFSTSNHSASLWSSPPHQYSSGKCLDARIHQQRDAMSSQRSTLLNMKCVIRDENVNTGNCSAKKSQMDYYRKNRLMSLYEWINRTIA